MKLLLGLLFKIIVETAIYRDHGVEERNRISSLESHGKALLLLLLLLIGRIVYA